MLFTVIYKVHNCICLKSLKSIKVIFRVVVCERTPFVIDSRQSVQVFRFRVSCRGRGKQADGN